MKKSLLFFGLILSTFTSFAQPPEIDAGPADTATCEDCIDLTATFVGGGNTTDYEISDITYAPDAYAGTSVSLSDDGFTGLLDIGFDFCFYGETYDEFRISANGWIGFGAGIIGWNPAAIPSVAGAVPKNCIMGPWQDLRGDRTGTIKYQTLGVSPFRRLVVTWENKVYYSCEDQEATQQIIIYETTNEIENHVEHKEICLDWPIVSPGRAVQGVHNDDGTEAVTYAGRNNTVYTITNEAILYTPLGDPIIEWYLGPLLISTGPDITVCPGSSTTYTAKLVSCGGVIAEDDILVEVICCEAPIMTKTDVSCFEGCDGTATADPIGVAPFTYLWDAAAGSQTTATAIDLCAGTYEITVTDALGCIETAEITIEEPEELIPAVSFIALVSCFGDTDGAVSVIAFGGTGAYTFDIGDGPVDDGYFSDLAVGPYSVLVTDENGCTATIDLSIEAPELLEAVLVEVVDVSCFGGDDGEITIDAVGGVIEFEFSIEGDPFVPIGVFGGLTEGTYDLQVVDENGCLADITVVVNEPPILTLDLVSTTNITCFEGADGVIEVLGAGGTGALEYSDDAVIFVPGAIFTDFEAGMHTFTVRDENGCETTLDVELTEPVPVSANEVVVAETCLGDCLGTIDLEGLDGVAPYTYSIDACGTTDSFGTYAGLCAGTYDVCIVDANGCEYTSAVEVLDGIPYADATILIGSTTFCVNDSPATLSSISPGGTFSGIGVVGGTFDPAVAGPGAHTITNIIDTDCGDVATIVITVNSLPVFSFSAVDNFGCESLLVPFTYTGDVGTSCTWEFGDGQSVDFCGSVNHLYLNAGIYDVTLTVADDIGCTNSITYFDYINVYEVPTAAFRFGPQPTTTINTEINFTDLSIGADLWDWTFDLYGGSIEQNPVFFFPENQGKYTVTLEVENSDGCKNSTVQVVVISEQLLIYTPNAITPDGDLYNEVFKPYFNGIDVQDYTLMLYNRWGEPIFESHNVAIGWNGTYNGEIVPTGVYIWHIIVDELSTDKKLEFHGHVTVLE